MITFEKYTGFFNNERGYLAYKDGKQVAQIEKRRSQWHLIIGYFDSPVPGERMSISRPFKTLKEAKGEVTKRYER